MTDYKTIQAEALGQWRSDSTAKVILDVRTDMEHAEVCLESPHDHVPLDQLNPVDFMTRRGLSKESEVYILCRSGKRAQKAADKFIEAGYNNVYVVEGGLQACQECGHAVQGHIRPGASKQGGPISLQRQVQIVVGGVIALGAGLALLVHPLFGWVPLFCGLGLLFAGITDRCGVALLLTKAPWNKIVQEKQIDP